MAIDLGVEGLFMAAAIASLAIMIVLDVSNRLLFSGPIFAIRGFASIFGRTALVACCGIVFARQCFEIWKNLSKPEPDIAFAVIHGVPALLVLVLALQAALALAVFVYANAFGRDEAPRRKQ